MWLYKDLTNAIREHGEKYPYTAVRKCRRCDKHEYKYAEWVDEELPVKQSGPMINRDRPEIASEKTGDKT
ncbi:MAG: hypothetical protein ABIT08_05565 [Bacteroidia bacterium]